MSSPSGDMTPPNVNETGMHRVPTDMQMPQRQPAAPFIDIMGQQGNVKRKKGDRNSMKVESGGGTGTNVPT